MKMLAYARRGSVVRSEVVLKRYKCIKAFEKEEKTSFAL